MFDHHELQTAYGAALACRMTTPTFNGRPLPPNDFEGDDFTPGAGGAYVTCQDTASGRMLWYATGGLCDLDGREIRAAIRPADSDGVSLPQVGSAIARLTEPSRILQWGLKPLPEIRAWSIAGLGLVVDGAYWAIPATFREQLKADFSHAVFVSHFENGRYRVWDPLNRDLSGYGKLIPDWAIEPFFRSLSGLCGWIDLESLGPSDEGNPMTNLVPTTVHRVVDLKAGTVLEKTPGGDKYTTLKAAITLGLLGATATHYHVADGDYGVFVPRSAATVRTADLNVGK